MCIRDRSRYGKSGLLAGMVTVIVVLGILPYISIQLKAIATSFSLLRQYPQVAMPAFSTQQPFWADTTFMVALVLIVFAILFGTRHIDTTAVPYTHLDVYKRQTGNRAAGIVRRGSGVRWRGPHPALQPGGSETAGQS